MQEFKHLSRPEVLNYNSTAHFFFKFYLGCNYSIGETKMAVSLSVISTVCLS